ncbi:unnamed protein product [Scytosiphon promiscuus]
MMAPKKRARLCTPLPLSSHENMVTGRFPPVRCSRWHSERHFAYLSAVEAIVDQASGVPRGVPLSNLQLHQPGGQPFHRHHLAILRVDTPPVVDVAVSRPG